MPYMCSKPYKCIIDRRIWCGKCTEDNMLNWECIWKVPIDDIHVEKCCKPELCDQVWECWTNR